MSTIDQNFREFQALLPTILDDHRGQYALLHSGKVKDYFSSSIEAIKVGLEHYGEGQFSVQHVDDQIEDLGFFSNVSSVLQA